MLDFRLIMAAGLMVAASSVCTLMAAPTPTQEPSPTVVPSSTNTATLPPPTATFTRIPDTETPSPTATFRPGIIEIRYGQKLTTIQVRRPTVTYAFRGQRDDVVTIRLQISNMHPTWYYCRSPFTADLVLASDTTDTPGNPTGSNVSSIVAHKLPQTGVYYISATCRGANCSRDCYEQTVSLDKQ